MTKIVIILITESSSFILSQTDLSVKVKGQTNKSRQIDKRTGTNRETCNTFTDFIRRCKVADKWVMVVDKSKEICTLWRRTFTYENVHTIYRWNRAHKIFCYLKVHSSTSFLCLSILNFETFFRLEVGLR